MKFSAPKVVTWWISVVLGILALLAAFNVVPAITAFGIWFAIVGLALLAVATVTKGL